MLLIVREMGWTCPYSKSDNLIMMDSWTFFTHHVQCTRILKWYKNLSSNFYINSLYTLSYEDLTLQEFTEMIRTDPANFFDSPEGVDWLNISSIIFDRSWNWDPQSCYKRSTTSSRARSMASCSRFSTTSQKQRWRSCQWEFQIYKSIIKRLHRL